MIVERFLLPLWRGSGWHSRPRRIGMHQSVVLLQQLGNAQLREQGRPPGSRAEIRAMVDGMAVASALRRQDSVLVRTMPCHGRSRWLFTRTSGCFSRTFLGGDRSSGSRIPYLDSQVRCRNTPGYIGGSWLCHLPRSSPMGYPPSSPSGSFQSRVELQLPHCPAHGRRWRTDSALPAPRQCQEPSVPRGGSGCHMQLASDWHAGIARRPWLPLRLPLQSDGHGSNSRVGWQGPTGGDQWCHWVRAVRWPSPSRSSQQRAHGDPAGCEHDRF